MLNPAEARRLWLEAEGDLFLAEVELDALREHRHALEQRIANQRRALAYLHKAHTEQKHTLACHQDFINAIPMEEFLSLMRRYQTSRPRWDESDEPLETDEQRLEREMWEAEGERDRAIDLKIDEMRARGWPFA